MVRGEGKNRGKERNGKNSKRHGIRGGEGGRGKFLFTVRKLITRQRKPRCNRRTRSKDGRTGNDDDEVDDNNNERDNEDDDEQDGSPTGDDRDSLG